jgi:hypothetical protein
MHVIMNLKNSELFIQHLPDTLDLYSVYGRIISNVL